MVISILILSKAVNSRVPGAAAHNFHVLTIEVAHNHVTNKFVSRITKFLNSFFDLLGHLNSDVFAEDWVILLIAQVCFQNVLNNWCDSVFLE